jgi:hypothetical protein
MRKNIDRVVNAFIAGRHCGGDSLSTCGNVIRSYDMPIAQRLSDGSLQILPTEAGPTATTRNHLSGVRVALWSAGINPTTVAVLTGMQPHVFRDRAGAVSTSGRTYLGRVDAKRVKPDAPAAVAKRRRLALVK